jgi:hypothetical protein
MTNGDAVVATWGHDWRAALPVRSADEQAALIAEARKAVASLQAAARGEGAAGHALHRKSILESSNASFEALTTVPKAIQIGPFTPGAERPASLRLSSAFPAARRDDVPDQRGLAVRVSDGARRLDLLATTGESHHARDARAMIASLGAAASMASGGVSGKLGALVVLIRAIGVRDALRMVGTVSRAAQAGVSLAAHTYYSRAPFQLGDFAVRYRFAPLGGVPAALRGTGPEPLALDLQLRLEERSLTWSLDLQGYLDSERTPMDDHRVPWRSPWIPVARLTLRGGRTPPPLLAFDPRPLWSAANGPVLEPLGDLNMLRGAAYELSQVGRRGRP